MSLEIRVPPLPESVADATIVAWRKQPGESVKRDETLADLETDKVVLEVPAPADGVLVEIRTPAGATVRSNDLMAIVQAGAAAAAAAPAPAAAAVGPGVQAAAAAAAGAAGAAAGRTGPAARHVMAEHGLNAGDVAGTGPGGRITKADAVAAAQGGGHDDMTAGATVVMPRSAIPAAALAPAAAPATPTSAAPVVPAPRSAATTGSSPRSDHRVPMTRLRARIAERMVEAQSTQALLTSFNEVDLTAVQELRARYKDTFEKKHGVRIGLLSFFVKAAVEALKRFPVVNAAVEGNDIVYHDYFDIGVAVSTDRGLMVPVLRNADAQSFADIEKDIAGYAAKARAGTITLQDLTGGTFSITNGGVFGSLLSTPIVNSPQSAILGLHKIQDRPMAVKGAVVIRPMMYLALTYDHRIIDGRDAVQFLVTIKECLEDPGRLLLGV